MTEWKLVPVKPTQEMKLRVNDNGGPGALAWAMAAYPDMLAAAPSAVGDNSMVKRVAEVIATAQGQDARWCEYTAVQVLAALSSEIEVPK